MASFFSADYWKALYFKAMGGQETAVDPNAMRGTFAGSASFTGTLALPEGFIAGSFAGTSEFTATALVVGDSLRGKLIRRRRWKRDEPPEWHPDDEYVHGRKPIQAAPLPIAAVVPKKLTAGFLSRLDASPEIVQLQVLEHLARKVAEASSSRKRLGDLNAALDAIGAEVIKREAKSRQRQEQIKAVQQEIFARQAEIQREIEEEDEMLILMAA